MIVFHPGIDSSVLVKGEGFGSFPGAVILELLIPLGQGRRTGVLPIAQMPDNASTDDRGQGYLRCQAAAVFFIRCYVK